MFINSLTGRNVIDPDYLMNSWCYGKEFADKKDSLYGGGVRSEEEHQKTINKLIK